MLFLAGDLNTNYSLNAVHAAESQKAVQAIK